MPKYEPMKNARKKVLFDDTPALKQKDRSRTKNAKDRTEADKYRRHSKEVGRQQ